MLELMIVITIILVLLGLATVGFKHVTKSGKQNATKTALETCKSMMAEFLAANQKNGTQTLNNYYNTPTYTGHMQAHAGTIEGESASRYTDDSIAFTQAVMGRLLAMPNNRATLQKIPASGLLGKPPTSVQSVLLPNATSSPNPPILLDGWGNPIIFVPSLGLTGVTVGGQANQPVLAPDNRPFFVSAGEDGDFSTGDDNVYSFEN
jgi:type II secretory pathway pseudopilin PulG